MDIASRVLFSASVATMACISGCHSLATEPASTTVTLSNRSGDSVAVALIELESSTRADPVVGPVAVSAPGRTVVPPYGEVSLDLGTVGGYAAGRDLRAFVYRVRAGFATLAMSMVVSDQELKAAKFRIEVALRAN